MDSTFLSFEETMQTDELEHHTFNNTLVDESVLDDDGIFITDDLDEHALLDEVPKINEINQQKETEQKCAAGDNEGCMRSLNFEDAEDSPNMHDDQLTIESLFERTDEKEEVTTEWASNITEMDNLTILGEKPELTLSKRDTTENGDHQVSDFRTIDDQAAISRLIDELVQKVSSDAPITTSTAEQSKYLNQSFDLF
ncbi:unnamed protein product, partial [Mesorhabditis belari]|uniref:Uncharacterized protein n=1 Tax=Mesorhabditis belari TaxID=2138241 RepID=A0AAF3FB35_9BILA